MDNKEEVVSVINDVIETCKDGEEGFRTCAEDIKNTELKGLFMKRSQECASAAHELQQLVRSLGGDPETTTSFGGDMHRRWVDLKSLITGKDETAILNECERGEDVALKRYQEALEKDLPAHVRVVIEQQYQGVKRNHDQIKALRNIARAQG
ncbi:MAG: PA2169 family four-helix-bundle protein [Pseudomonadota bacterium]